MLVQLLAILLVLNVFTHEAVAQVPDEPCKDQPQTKYCESAKSKGLCNSKEAGGMMKRRCAKTCGFCTEK
ncbi:shTK domain protein [Oesophagostomum dentatum]|uniref:ShTK domain protein n=1 Tax=Oesophagostomum dentatum TaxID=61180 RepID=A0A0B1SNM5_OESDE|nr:shTK domain protein [Oesophagostomum dentatum]